MTSSKKITALEALILDRDGVIIESPSLSEGKYTFRIEDVKIYPRVIEALKLLNKKTKIIIITNQAGIAHGKYTEEDYKKVRDFIYNIFEKNGIHVTAEYVCMHHPLGTVAPYNIICNCRKPATGLFELAIKEHGLNPNNCWTIGDMRRDIIAGQKVGMKGILVKTGLAGKGGTGDEVTPDYIADDLYDAIKYIKAH